MAALKIANAGLQLESSPSSRDSLPLQAFGITLNDNMIEDMIRCVQGGQNVEVTLGNNPSFHYGSREEKVSVTPESFNYELYLTDLGDSGSKTQRLSHPTMSILKKPPTSLSKKPTKVTAKHTNRASSSGADSDADIRAQKRGKGPKLANGGPKGSKLLPTGRSMATVLSSTTRSLPSSPALNGVASPNPAFSASQQVFEKNKGQRSVLVHELAVRDQPFQRLKDVWTGADSDLKPTVEKVASFNKSTEKWSLKKIYWKELDVWSYDYDTPEDRQSAIDNAIKVYDKQRVVLSDAVWDRLLPREDRNKNIVLSKLQASIAKQSTIPPAPKVSGQKAEEGNKSDMDSSKAKGEAMSRSNSQPITSKPKKISEREAQTKRLLSNNPKKPAPKKPTSKVKATEEKGKRVLSEEFVYDTDTSQDEAPLSQNTTTASKPKLPPKPTEKPAEKPVARMSEKPKEPPAPSTSLKPKPKPAVRPPRGPIKAPVAINKSPQKRPREDEESSSSSGAPLSKRIKPRELPKPVTEPKAPKHRASDASQNSRGTNSTTSTSFTKTSKNTSPTKSSPLATSPPTNASDLDERPSSQRPPNRLHQHPPPIHRNGERGRERGRDRGQAHSSTNSVSNSNSTASSAPSSNMVSKKRKERDSTDESPETTPTPPTKKPRLAADVLIQARRFTKYYEKYEALHYEIAALKDPPEDKLTDLLDMRARLVNMKREIQRAAASAA
ncbi:hypothetical protein F4801DRAFT_531087 [Xylaria longipes]|nr:hypothetical protein F4801DRAFT_531087 [Xylaria longipes]RYC59864.1 hypothetical protein CHU98_g6349 [Xylaria longipes]